MGENSKISWTDSTFNPWIGCTKVSPGCANCYAETRNKRFGGDNWGVGKLRRRTVAANWNMPLKWNREAKDFLQCNGCGWRGVSKWVETFDPITMGKTGEARGCRRCGGEDVAEARQRVFCASLADWLDHEVPAEWLADLLTLIAETPNLDWQLLTKRPELWRNRLSQVAVDQWDLPLGASALAQEWLDGNPPANVWVGTTVEDQARANERIPALLQIPARVRFLSMEPLLEAVAPPLDGIGWVIVGGESGSKARPFDLSWARSIVHQCADAGVPVWVKQMGANPVNPFSLMAGGEGLRLPAYNHPAGADPAEWPADLRVQQLPEVDHD